MFGVCWKVVCLAFSCKSSPKIFNILAEALCWILRNVCRLPFVLHLLDDFLVVVSPSSPPGLCTLSSAFQHLGLPLFPEKTLGSSMSLEFLGIQLDSVLFQASIPPGCSLISYLHSIASPVPSLQHRLSLDDACISELRFWLFLLQHWNGISLFYEDAILVPEHLQLFTDAAPSIGFGGCWFASPWPPEFALHSLESGNSSALWELYPVVIAALLWGHEWTGGVILIHSDNSTAVHIINKGRSKYLTFMPFLYRLTWHSFQNRNKPHHVSCP
ncbi:hypothetical protein SRHO_G00180340 [Serrasalmus rhombeus]